MAFFTLNIKVLVENIWLQGIYLKNWLILYDLDMIKLDLLMEARQFSLF